jgi:hypothetical protein
MNPAGQFPSTPGQHMKAVRVIFIAIITGMIIFAGVVILVLYLNGSLVKEIGKGTNNVLLWSAFGVAVLASVGARKLYQQRVEKIKNTAGSLNEKLNQYRSAVTVFLALCEVPGLLAISLFFLTGNYLLLIVPGLMAAVMLTKWPSRQRVIDDLAIGWEQQQEL